MVINLINQKVSFNKCIDMKSLSEMETANLNSQNSKQEVLFQTMMVKLKMSGQTRTVRALIDSE